jgi:hypothetical protein
MLRLITGAPGCGKTTRIVEKLSEEFNDKIIWVAEPYQSIVYDKSKKNKNSRVRFINWATALGDGSMDGFNYGKPDDLIDHSDILVMDEVHLLYSSEYRGFFENNIKTLKQTYNNLILITATPNEVINEINELRQPCEHVHVQPRLKRNEIKINLYDTHISKFLNSVNIRVYSILNVNNVKQLYSIGKHWKNEVAMPLGNSVLIRSYFSEINNFMFSQRHIEEIRDCELVVAKDVFLGTVALGQGIDKDLKRYTLTDNTVIEKTMDVFLGTEVDEPVEVLEEKLLFDANSYKIDKTEFALYEYIAQNIIQGDRYRYDANLNIDVLYSLNDKETYDLFIGELKRYVYSVYGDIKLEVNIVIPDEFAINNVIGSYKYKDFKVCLDNYNKKHKENRKSLTERFEEILKALLDDSTDVFKRRNGAIKTASKMVGDLFEKFTVDDAFFCDQTIRYYKVVKALPKFIEFLKSEELSTKYIADKIKNKLPDELVKKERGLENLSEEDLRDEAVKELGVFVETVFIMTIKLLGYNLNFANELTERGRNDGTLCPKKLRGLMICKDYDLKGAHIAALVKAFSPDYDIKKLIDETDIYDITGLIEMDRIINIMLNHKGFKNLKYEDLLAIYKDDRGIIKQVLISCINSLNVKDRKELIIDYLKSKFGIVTVDQDWLDLATKMNKYFIPKKNKKIEDGIGFYNGSFFENEWLGHINKITELFRIYDGFAAILEEGNADKVREEIESKYNVKMSEEPIKKIDGCNYKNFNDFYNEVADASEDEMRAYIKANIKDTFYKLAAFGTFISKGRCKGKNTGIAINEKLYTCLKDRNINEVEYKTGEIYTFGKDLYKTVGNYNKRYFKRIIV